MSQQKPDAVNKKAERAATLDRDRGRSRWPFSTNAGAIEVAHLQAKGMGGDPLGIRSKRENLITLTLHEHRGARSLHSGHRKIVPVNPELGANAGVECWIRESLKSPWRLVGVSFPPA